MYRNSLSLIVLSKKYPLVKPPLYLSYPHLQPMACNSIQISIVLFFMYNTSHLSILFGKHFLIEAVWLVNLFYKPRSNRCRDQIDAAWPSFMSLQLCQDLIHVGLPLSHYHLMYTNYQPINSLTTQLDHSSFLWTIQQPYNKAHSILCEL